MSLTQGNSIKMFIKNSIKSLVIFYLSILFGFSISFAYKGIPCKTSPEPNRCFQSYSIVCASTACAMVMTFWEKVNVVLKKGCDYSKEFKFAFGTFDGRSYSNPALFESAFRKVVVDNGNLLVGFDKEISVLSNRLSFWWKIRDLIRNTESNSKKSPWNRPGVLVILGKNHLNYGHAKLLWGIKSIKIIKRKRHLIINYITKDPLPKKWRRITKFKPRYQKGFATFWWPIKKCKVEE